MHGCSSRMPILPDFRIGLRANEGSQGDLEGFDAWDVEESEVEENSFLGALPIPVIRPPVFI